MKPYIAKVAFYVVPEEDFDQIVKAVDEQTTSYSYRELCNGEGVYLEFEVAEIEKPLPVIGNVKELGVDIVQAWLDLG